MKNLENLGLITGTMIPRQELKDIYGGRYSLAGQATVVCNDGHRVHDADNCDRATAENICEGHGGPNGGIE